MYLLGDDKMKLDIKTLITIVTFAATMGGFYYTTQLRLSHLEENVAGIEKKIKHIKKSKTPRKKVKAQ